MYGISTSPLLSYVGTTVFDLLYPKSASFYLVTDSVSVGYFLSTQYAGLKYGRSTYNPWSGENLRCSSYVLFSGPYQTSVKCCLIKEDKSLP